MCVCVELLKRSKTCTHVTSAVPIYLFISTVQKYSFIYLCICRIMDLWNLFCLAFVSYAWFWNSCLSRGTGADLPIQSNEAMANQWMGGLINHLYLLHGHDEGDVQTLVMRVSFLGFLFQAVGAYLIKMEHASLSWTWHRTCYKSYPSV